MSNSNPMFQVLSAVLVDVAVSPAMFMELPTGEMLYEDYENTEFYTVNDTVLFGGKVWKIWGFTLSREVILRPYGLGHDRLIRSMVVKPEGIRHLPPDESYVLRHKDGLISFES